ncbi:hypothetical protein NDU88_004488 [Pleurodeles waltl]|uniref:Uncharacterized protein n=1 Tax=Pleurodeles waltl TaxID=8319 RepID=A0AAV7UJ91_PLEWA|nr:hypothetical protein NDU88_004488 [Pleurodeles waltl]
MCIAVLPGHMVSAYWLSRVVQCSVVERDARPLSLLPGPSRLSQVPRGMGDQVSVQSGRKAACRNSGPLCQHRHLLRCARSVWCSPPRSGSGSALVHHSWVPSSAGHATISQRLARAVVSGPHRAERSLPWSPKSAARCAMASGPDGLCTPAAARPCQVPQIQRHKSAAQPTSLVSRITLRDSHSLDMGPLNPGGISDQHGGQLEGATARP